MSQASNECLPSKSRTDSIVCDQVNGQQEQLLPVNHRPNAEACDQGSKQSSSGNSSFKFSILQGKVDSRATSSSSAATGQRSIAERPAPSTTSGQRVDSRATSARPTRQEKNRSSPSTTSFQLQSVPRRFENFCTFLQNNFKTLPLQS